MKLENIGFYTLSDERAASATPSSPLQRCELLVTNRCNFACPYCRGTPADANITYEEALAVVEAWGEHDLHNIRFSGGEPTLVPWLPKLVSRALGLGARVAVSTNGSAHMDTYRALLRAGVTDFSVSLDACCASVAEAMAGRQDVWDHVVETIRALAAVTYTTVGVVVTEATAPKLPDVVQFAHDLGVADIRIISAAQWNGRLLADALPPALLAQHPILRYRVNRQIGGQPVRGLALEDSHTCALALDDMAVRGDYHYPCIIHMREGGAPVGKVGPAMRDERTAWVAHHDTHADPICSRNCLDVCVAYNNRWRAHHGEVCAR